MSVCSNRLRELADTDLSYPGWDKDYEEANEAFQIGSIKVFERIFSEIKEKQRRYDNHHISVRLEVLEYLDVRYLGCKEDKRKVETWCRTNAVNRETQEKFEERLQGLVNKDSVYKGDRSHPNLVKLDDSIFTFPGWEEEYENAVKAHCEEPFSVFPTSFHQMQEKQHKHEGRRIHWRLVLIDELGLSYPGFKEDIAEVEAWHFRTMDSPSTASLFRETVDGLLEQEELYLEVTIQETKEKKSYERKGIFFKRKEVKRTTQKKKKASRDPEQVVREPPLQQQKPRPRIAPSRERKTQNPINAVTSTRKEPLVSRKSTARFRPSNPSRDPAKNFRQEPNRLKETTTISRNGPKPEQLPNSRNRLFRFKESNHFRDRTGIFRQQERIRVATSQVRGVMEENSTSGASSYESSVDSLDIEVDKCYRRIAASLKALEENKKIQEQSQQQSSSYNHQSRHKARHSSPTRKKHIYPIASFE